MEQVERIDYTDDGTLDDVTVSNVSMFRLEKMSGTGWWIRVYRDGLDDLVFWLNSSSEITIHIERE